MRGKWGRGVLGPICVMSAVFLFGAFGVRCQEPATGSAPAASAPLTERDVQSLADAVRLLEGQVQALNSQVSDLKAQQQSSRAEVEELHKEIDAARQDLVARPVEMANSNAAASSQYPVAPVPAGQESAAMKQAAPQRSVEDRLADLENQVEYQNEKISDQAQTKVESASKYRVRLSGIVLLNLFGERGTVDNLDVPEVAMPPSAVDSAGAFGGTLRQSEIGLEAFGPDVAGARTSADIRFDFAGGFPGDQNGATMGMMRLRTGTIRMDWGSTSLIAGQDYLFFSPLAPSSLASLAVPPLSYSGNLWGWTPQIRIEHRVDLSEDSKVTVTAGILDSLTGDVAREQSERYPSWGEQSGQPAYATHIGWSTKAFGQDLSIGAGGLYARQSWGFGRDVDGWLGSADVNIPLGSRVAFSGEFYRGRAVGGYGGGIGQTILVTGPFSNPAAPLAGLDSMGGWAQLKFKLTRRFEINAAAGDDSPFAGEMRRYAVTKSYYGPPLVRNWSPLVNFIYQPKSDILFSTEYRRLATSPLSGGSNSANFVNVSLGYLF